MLKPSRIAACLTAVLACLAGAPAAGAHAGERSLQQTFPLASRLCAQVARGEGPRRLRGSAPAVDSACAQLQSSFAAAQNAVLLPERPLIARLAAQEIRTRAVCSHRPFRAQLCARARARRRNIEARLERERRLRARSYYAAVEADRAAFWATIHALPGGATVVADRPITPLVS